MKNEVPSRASVPLVIVAGMSKPQRVLGKENKLLWHVPDDLRRFKTLTLGHPVILGRKTFASIISILGKPLPGRTNIVVTRDQTFTHESAVVAHSLPEAIETAHAENPQEIHIGGGAKLYRQALPLVSRLHITWFFDDKDGDAFFPPFEHEFTVTAEHPKQTCGEVTFQWVDYERNRS